MCSTSGNRLVSHSTQQWGPARETMTIRLPIHRLHIMGVHDVWDRVFPSLITYRIMYYILVYKNIKYLCTYLPIY